MSTDVVTCTQIFCSGNYGLLVCEPNQLIDFADFIDIKLHIDSGLFATSWDACDS
ncbi:hypothetical protein CREGCYN_01010 [Synechococcus sp. M16CYN]